MGKGLSRLSGKLLYCGLLMILNACAMVGPDFTPPKADVAPEWVEAKDSRIQKETPDYRNWWRVFGDPVLEGLVQTAYEQNLPLRIAGVRVLEARALLGVVVGDFYPQTQTGSGALLYNRISGNSIDLWEVEGYDGGLGYWQGNLGLGASWELDFWGKFRRAIQSADANVLGSIAAYDDVLVSLTADVARTYVIIRVYEERLRIAHENLKIQKEGLRIAKARFDAGDTGERDVQQALTQFTSTQAQIPFLETGIQKARHALSILLGMAPGQLRDRLNGDRGIPQAPLNIAAGIPAQLLRRRPDIRNAELQAASQCALIGVAKADLYPSFSLSGSFGFLSADVGNASVNDIFSWSSRTAVFGPSFKWNILNYGRITNNVRVQDARLQGLILSYQDTVLRAQQEVEDGLVEFLKAQERVGFLRKCVDAAKRSADLALMQYRGGSTDYTTVIQAQQALLSEQDRLADTQGESPLGLVAVYRALGGGWEIREGKPFVPEDVKSAMMERTDWGSILSAPLEPPPAPDSGKSLLRGPDW
jgi:NodT family efflux transporter outer membrane factor (OMF) lipoprotein